MPASNPDSQSRRITIAPLKWVLAVGGALRWLWLQLGVTLLIVAGLELTVRSCLNLSGAGHSEDSRVHADAYGYSPWAREVLREYNERSVRWQPYGYWVGAIYNRRYTHVDANGIRATWKNPAPCPPGRRPPRIFMFGGSTVWGEGARDEYTIPSWLQRMLARRGSCATVTNFGQDGYVSAQEVILLMDQIRRGSLPDLAIFYDGYNDAHSAMVNGTAGVTYDEETRRREFNLGNTAPGDWGHLATNWVLLAEVSLSRIAHAMSLSDAARRIIAKCEPRSYVEINGVLVRRFASQSHAVRDAALEAAVARDYLANIEMAGAMAQRFGFRCLFYWQPWLGDKYPLSAYEREQLEGFPPGYRQFVRAIGERVSGGGDRTIRFLSDTFSNTPGPYFIDDVHIIEDGNRLIARRMLPDVLTAIQQIDNQAPVKTASRGE